MSYLKSNIDIFAKEVRAYTADEVAVMTTKQFDELPLCDQISIFHNHRDAYNRLTGHTDDNNPDLKDNRTESVKAIDEYEKLVDDVITRTFHPNGA